MPQDVASIAGHFDLAGEPEAIAPITAGHINDTYLLTTTAGDKAVRYVLQRINHYVFKDPPKVMENILRVTEHIRDRLSHAEPALARRQLTVVPARDGQGYYQDADGNFWRAYAYIENAVTYDTVPSTALAREAARMFGWFQKLLRDLPSPPLHETIPGFHDTPRRLEYFEQVLQRDVRNRAKQAVIEIDFVLENAALCAVLPDLVGKGDFPMRTAHNDTKINNVMLDETAGTGVCIIDLDTVMPGLSVHDFGDLVRTASCPAAEDERDLSKVAVDVPLFEALTQGFAEETRQWLTPVERNHLVFGAKIITFEQMIRFLTDYLAGDLYYKVHREGHNLDRARTQMKLVQSIVEQEESLNGLVQRAFQNNPGGAN
ncbi:MAG: aminoglycoside phosphotransferase family protein [Phycisphaerales bacterium]